MERILTLNAIRQLACKVMPEGAQVWLYGSRARGEAREDSGWDYASAVSPQIYSLEDWKRQSFMPFYQNVERDKVHIA